jgi:hypothetical protein
MHFATMPSPSGELRSIIADFGEVPADSSPERESVDSLQIEEVQIECIGEAQLYGLRKKLRVYTIKQSTRLKFEGSGS